MRGGGQCVRKWMRGRFENYQREKVTQFHKVVLARRQTSADTTYVRNWWNTSRRVIFVCLDYSPPPNIPLCPQIRNSVGVGTRVIPRGLLFFSEPRARRKNTLTFSAPFLSPKHKNVRKFRERLTGISLCHGFRRFSFAIELERGSRNSLLKDKGVAIEKNCEMKFGGA